MRSVEERFPELRFLYWSPARWDTPPNRGSNPLLKWALDGIPYYTFSILYVEATPARGTNSTWMLEVHHRADTALYDDTFMVNSDEPSLAKMPASGESASELHLVAWLRHDAAEETDWRQDVWAAHDWPTEDRVLEPVQAGTISRLRHRLDLAELTSRTELEQAVDQFRVALIENDFPLKASDSEL
jgi:hypothetical protein